MADSFANFHPALQAFLATCFTWGMTALGAATVFFTREVSRRMLDGQLGFASGVMLAASFWSLLAPAIAMSQGSGVPAWFPVAVGFLGGALALRGIDRILPHLHLGFPMNEAEGIRTSWQRATLLVTAITLHNIPEGLAVGVAFGAVAAGIPEATLPGALALAFGIGLQNFPEGLVVAMAVRREGRSPLRSFWYGQLSAVVEPLAAVCGALAVLALRQLLPYAMGFAAGAMVFVVLEETIPEAERSGNTDLASMAGIVGFVIMMILDVAFS